MPHSNKLYPLVAPAIFGIGEGLQPPQRSLAQFRSLNYILVFRRDMEYQYPLHVCQGQDSALSLLWLSGSVVGGPEGATPPPLCGWRLLQSSVIGHPLRLSFLRCFPTFPFVCAPTLCICLPSTGTLVIRGNVASAGENSDKISVAPSTMLKCYHTTCGVLSDFALFPPQLMDSIDIASDRLQHMSPNH